MRGGRGGSEGGDDQDGGVVHVIFVLECMFAINFFGCLDFLCVMLDFMCKNALLIDGLFD